MQYIRTFVLIFMSSLSFFSVGETCTQHEEIVITTEDIFDLSEPDTMWVHDLANTLNVVTRPETIENEIAFLTQNCEIQERDLQEVERHLRKLKYINTATASRRQDGAIAITTSDKWTLMPTIDVSRKGGQNTFSLGLKDRNLLGYGIDAEVAYFKDVQRAGYTLDLQFPIFTDNNIYGSLTLTDTDDGSSKGFSIVRPFVSFHTDNAFSISAFSSDLRQQYFLNGKDYFSVDISEQLASASWGKLYSFEDKEVIRYTFGADFEKHVFRNLELPDFINNALLPRDRTYLSPFIQLDYIEDNFKELSNVHVINQIEDFNLGWQLQTKLGVNIATRDNDESLFIAGINASKGTQLTDKTLLLSELSFLSNFGSTQKSRYVLGIDNELFHTLSDKFGLYGAQHLTWSKNQFLDMPIVIGEENGVRGYPLQFQRGTSSVSFTGEFRYYPNISIFQLAELGAAAFIDTGRSFGTDDFSPQREQWLSSVGVGARLYSRHASDTRVIHLDVSFPMLKDDNVNNVEFLITTKASF